MSNPNDLPPPASVPAPVAAKEPFSHQAAKFSAYAPFILFLLGMCLQGQNKAHAGTEAGAQLLLVLRTIFFLTTLSAFVLGLVALAGGIVRRASWTIWLAVAGVLLNSAILTLWVVILVRPISHRATPPRVASDSEAWTAISLMEKLSLEFPGSPQHDVKSIGEQGETTVTSYRFDDGAASYMGMIFEFGKDARLPTGDIDTSDWLDSRLDDWKNSLNGWEVRRNAVTLGTLTGREQQFEFNPPAKNRQGQQIV